MRKVIMGGSDQTHGHEWAPYALMMLALWLASAPFTFGYSGEPMAVSDWISAGLILGVAIRLVRSPCLWAQWVGAGVGSWLMLSPLLFWTKSPAAYDAATLIGALTIVFCVVLPRWPLERDTSGTDIPAGWTYNPSAWIQRAPIVAMAFFGFLISRHLAAFQLGHVEDVWEPFFGDGTRQVLQSEVSRAFPVSDAGLGAVSYLIEAITGLIGGTRRWRTMPWMVMLFSFLVVPLGVVSIVLIILQPLAVGAWCTLCLVTALSMLVMIAPAADEVVATVQFLTQSHCEGKPLWRTLFFGGSVPGDSRTGPQLPPSGPIHSWIGALFGLNRITWTLVASAGLGIWLMVAPSVFGTTGQAAGNDHLIGPLVVTFAVIALSEIARMVRWVNAVFGVWLLAAPWVLSTSVSSSRWNDMAVGVMLVLLAIPRGEIRERFGGFNRYIV